MDNNVGFGVSGNAKTRRNENGSNSLNTANNIKPHNDEKDNEQAEASLADDNCRSNLYGE
ncbi:hypothetical protein FZC66_08745 [Priestia megaterium]|nr:hypothetical protein FZC66_08745 [Priestia megaterium]